MADKAKAFITLFNELHHVLEELAGRDLTFSNAIHMLRRKNVWVGEYFDELDNIRRLRNFMVHEQTDVRYPVAEPSDAVLDLMDKLIQKLKNPETAAVFKKKVYTFQTTDALPEVLYRIKQDHRSQYPVFDDQENFSGLLSDYGIVDYLSDQVHHPDDGPLAIEGIQVQDILPYDKKRLRYRVVHQDLPLYQVKELVSETFEGGQSPVLLVTQYGELHQRRDLIGIITPLDLPEINQVLRR